MKATKDEVIFDIKRSMGIILMENREMLNDLISGSPPKFGRVSTLSQIATDANWAFDDVSYIFIDILYDAAEAGLSDGRVDINFAEFIGAKDFIAKMIREGFNKVTCIKELRALTGFGLKETKRIVEQIAEEGNLDFGRGKRPEWYWYSTYKRFWPTAFSGEHDPVGLTMKIIVARLDYFRVLRNVVSKDNDLDALAGFLAEGMWREYLLHITPEQARNRINKYVDDFIAIENAKSNNLL